MTDQNMSDPKVELNGTSSYLATVPVTLPLVYHHPLVPGPVTSERVQAGLRAYGTVGQIFLEATLWLRSRPHDSLFADDPPKYGSRHFPACDEDHAAQAVPMKFLEVQPPAEDDMSSPAALVNLNVARTREYNFNKSKVSLAAAVPAAPAPAAAPLAPPAQPPVASIGGASIGGEGLDNFLLPAHYKAPPLD